MNQISPDWIIQIEVVGENTGISVLKLENIFKKL
jgi:tRNA acetyltransferase TAN1